MRSLNNIKAAALLAVVVAFTAGPDHAEADVINYGADFYLSCCSNSSFGGGPPRTRSNTLQRQLPQFDSLLGVLTGVDISFTSDYRRQIYTFAQDTRGYSCGRFWCNDAWTNGTSVASLLITPLNLAGAGKAGDTNTYNWSCSDDRAASFAGRYCRDSNASLFDFNGALDLGNVGLNAFVGNGSLDFELRNSVSLAGFCDKDTENSWADQCHAENKVYWTGRISVAYTYTAAPPSSVSEPAILSLFGFGFLGMALVRRRIR